MCATNQQRKQGRWVYSNVIMPPSKHHNIVISLSVSTDIYVVLSDTLGQEWNNQAFSLFDHVPPSPFHHNYSFFVMLYLSNSTKSIVKCTGAWGRGYSRPKVSFFRCLSFLFFRLSLLGRKHQIVGEEREEDKARREGVRYFW